MSADGAASIITGRLGSASAGITRYEFFRVGEMKKTYWVSEEPNSDLLIKKTYWVPFTPAGSCLIHLADSNKKTAIKNLLAVHMPYGTWTNFKKRGYTIENIPEFLEVENEQ